MEHSCKTNQYQEAETGGPTVQGQPGLPHETMFQERRKAVFTECMNKRKETQRGWAGFPKAAQLPTGLKGLLLLLLFFLNV